MPFSVLFTVGLWAILATVGILIIKISENKLVEQTKRAEKGEAKYKSLLASIGEGIVVTDAHGRIELINQRAEQMVGWSAGEVVGKNWKDIVPLVDEKGELIPGEKRALRRVIETGRPVANATYYYVRRDGSKFPVGTTAAPIKHGDQLIGAIAVFRDITKERDIDRAKSEFVSLASHQLRTPLSAIKWFAEMLINGDAGEMTEEQKEYVKNIDLSNERMIALVDSLLNISRIESGRIIIDPKPTDLSKLVNELATSLAVKLQERQIDLVVSAYPNLPVINVDPKLVSQVYLNLLTNAIKYSPPGGKIVVMISQKDAEIVSQITDAGYGIPEAEKTKVFQKFYRGGNIVKQETDGTGLGLYLAKAVVESSGGRIWFESKEGEGTSFWFTLPLGGSTAKAGEVTLSDVIS